MYGADIQVNTHMVVLFQLSCCEGTWKCNFRFHWKPNHASIRTKTVWLANRETPKRSSGFHGRVGEVSMSMRHWFLLAFWARSCKQHTCSLSHSFQLKPEVIGTSRPLCFIMRLTARRKQALVQNRFALAPLAASLTKANAFRVLRTRREGWFTMVPVRERYWPPSGFTNPSKIASANCWITLWCSILRAQSAKDWFGRLKQWWFWIECVKLKKQHRFREVFKLGPKKSQESCGSNASVVWKYKPTGICCYNPWKGSNLPTQSITIQGKRWRVVNTMFTCCSLHSN